MANSNGGSRHYTKTPRSILHRSYLLAEVAGRQLQARGKSLILSNLPLLH
ncbi:hypothetical protein AXF42_Ash017166 [Apostasia shenzhenica]|uniref:Uncharacterized protein n=1 Tax=Apostasia shenzhenica TaxID=1088818 RepID=A0A2H9ZV93_9ASPA|nr:hypothetical protein AXF42_Ash017166 [Apostasia shenzhenica]